MLACQTINLIIGLQINSFFSDLQPPLFLYVKFKLDEGDRDQSVNDTVEALGDLPGKVVVTKAGHLLVFKNNEKVLNS